MRILAKPQKVTRVRSQSDPCMGHLETNSLCLCPQVTHVGVGFRGIVRSMTRAIWMASMILAATAAAQQPTKKPFQAQATSTIAYRVDKDEEIVETTSVAWQVTGTDIPGRPKNERLVRSEERSCRERV